MHAPLFPVICTRATAAPTWKQVAQLYLSRPLLWKGRKFDLRIVALLVSTKPLELYVHNCYWPRVAERPHETEREASLEDPRVCLTATHLIGETAVGEACHPHYEVIRLLLLFSVLYKFRRQSALRDGLLSRFFVSSTKY